MLTAISQLIAQYRSLFTVIAAILIPRILPSILSFVLQRRRPSSQTSPSTNSPRRHGAPREPGPDQLKYLLMFHTIYQVWQLFLPPYDVFISEHLSLLVGNDTLRDVVLRSLVPSGSKSKTRSKASAPAPGDIDLLSSEETHPLVELLLTKLSLLEGRYLYSRYGHQTLLDCLWCTSSEDYMVYSLPAIMGPYLLVGVTIGLMGLSIIGGRQADHRAKTWRTWMGWLLVGGAGGEAAARYFWEVRAVKGECTHLSPNIHILRTFLLLLLPIIYTILPLSPEPPNPQDLIPSLASAQNFVRISALSRSAITRDRTLRQIQTDSIDEQVRVERLAAAHPGVQRATAEAGIQIDQIRRSGHTWLNDVMGNVIRIATGPDDQDT